MLNAAVKSQSCKLCARLTFRFFSLKPEFCRFSSSQKAKEDYETKLADHTQKMTNLQIQLTEVDKE